MDEKNTRRNDNDMANEMLEKLRKMLKLPPLENVAANDKASSNAVKPAEKSDAKPADEVVSAQLEQKADKPEEHEYDGIISRVDHSGESKKKAKKYKGIPDDEPLFYFDSFEKSEDDEPEISIVRAETAEEIDEISEVAETSEEIEEIAEVAETSEEIEEIAEVAETAEEIGEIAEVAETAEEIEEIAEVAETAEEIEEIVEVAETAEEIEEIVEVAETAEEIEEIVEVAETAEEIEEIAEVAETADEYEEIAEVAKQVEEHGEAMETVETQSEPGSATTESEDDGWSSVRAEHKSEKSKYSAWDEIEAFIAAERKRKRIESGEYEEEYEEEYEDEYEEYDGYDEEYEETEEPMADEPDVGDEPLYAPVENASVLKQDDLWVAEDIDSIEDEGGAEDESAEADTEYGIESDGDPAEEEELPSVALAMDYLSSGAGSGETVSASSEADNRVDARAQLSFEDVLGEPEIAETAVSGETIGEIEQLAFSGVSELSDEVAESGSGEDELFGEEDPEDAPALAYELEEAVSIAEEYQTFGVTGGITYDEDEAEFEDEPLAVAVEVEELLLATELDSTIVAPEDVEDEKDDSPEEDSTDPDWVPSESFLRECAQLELPKLSAVSRPVNESESDEIPEEKSSRYIYVDPPLTEDDRTFEEASDGAHDASANGETAADGSLPGLGRALKIRFRRRRSENSASNCVIYLGILALISLLLENLGGIASNAMTEVFFGASALLILIFDTMLPLIGIMLTGVSVRNTLSGFGRFRLNCDSIGLLSAFVTTVYGIVMAVMTGGTGEGVRLLGFPATVCILITAVMRTAELRRDNQLFEETAEPSEYAVLAELERNNGVPEIKEFEGMVNEDAPIFCVNKNARTNGGYRLNGQCKTAGRFGAVMTLIALVASVTAGVLLWFYGKRTPADAIYLAALSLMASVPTFMTVSFFAQRGLLLKRTGADGAFPLTDDAADRLENGATVLIEDVDLFDPAEIRIIGFDLVNCENEADPDFERALGHIISAFHKIGGSLSGLFATVEQGVRLTDDVRFTDLSERGVSALVEGVYVRVGSDAYMGKYGIPVIPDQAERAPSEKTVYVSENGVLRAKLVLAFSADKQLVDQIRRLRGYGITVSLKTCDPSIDPELILFTTGLEPELLRVVRYNLGDEHGFSHGERDGAIVSKNGTEGLIAAVRHCAVYCGALKLTRMLSVLLWIVSAGAAVAAVFFSMPSAHNALLLGGYQLLSAVLAAISARILR